MKIVGHCGDSSPITEGGTIVLADATCIHFEPIPDKEKYVWVNQYDAERLKLVCDIGQKTEHYICYAYDNSWAGDPCEREEWWTDRIQEACKSVDVEVESFWENITDEAPERRAWAYEVIGGHFGYHELSGGNEEICKVADWRKRLALPAWQARTRKSNKVNVYA